MEICLKICKNIQKYLKICKKNFKNKNSKQFANLFKKKSKFKNVKYAKIFKNMQEYSKICKCV